MTIKAILGATAHNFITHSYAKTNIIAEHAGGSIGLLYQYFPNKDAIIEALHHRHVQRMQKTVLKAMRNPMNFKNRKSLFAVIQAIVTAHLLEPKLHLKFKQMKTLECWTPSDESGSGAIQQQVEYIISALPHISKRKRKLYTFTLVHTVHALVHASAFKRPADMPVKAMIEETVKVVERYLEI